MLKQICQFDLANVDEKDRSSVLVSLVEAVGKELLDFVELQEVVI